MDYKNLIISINNQRVELEEEIILETHFDEKINSLYGDLSSLNFIELNQLKGLRPTWILYQRNRLKT